MSNDKRKSPFRCQMEASGASHDISHEEEVRGRSRVKIREDMPRRERVDYGGKRNVFRLERKESREVQERR